MSSIRIRPMLFYVQSIYRQSILIKFFRNIIDINLLYPTDITFIAFGLIIQFYINSRYIRLFMLDTFDKISYTISDWMQIRI